MQAAAEAAAAAAQEEQALREREEATIAAEQALARARAAEEAAGAAAAVAIAAAEAARRATADAAAVAEEALRQQREPPDTTTAVKEKKKEEERETADEVTDIEPEAVEVKVTEPEDADEVKLTASKEVGTEDAEWKLNDTQMKEREVEEGKKELVDEREKEGVGGLDDPVAASTAAASTAVVSTAFAAVDDNPTATPISSTGGDMSGYGGGAGAAVAGAEAEAAAKVMQATSSSVNAMPPGPGHEATQSARSTTDAAAHVWEGIASPWGVRKTPRREGGGSGPDLVGVESSVLGTTGSVPGSSLQQIREEMPRAAMGGEELTGDGRAGV